MSEADFELFSKELEQRGTAAALICLAKQLRNKKKYHELFEVLKMQTRHRLGLPLLYQDGTDSLEGEQGDQLEKGLLDACREVGGLLMRDGQIREGWMYLRPVGNKSEVIRLLEEVPVDEEQVDQLIEVAFHEGVDPARGYELILERYGTCNAITTLESQLPALEPTARQASAGLLLRHVYDELRTNVMSHVEREEDTAPAAETSLEELIAGRSWLTEGGNYHIDTSHLASTVRVARVIEDAALLGPARELCEYGRQLDESLQYPGEEPFTETYAAHHRYFSVLLRDNVEDNLAFFREKAESVDMHYEGTLAAETYIELLARCGNVEHAIAESARLIPPGTHVRGVAPSLLELSRRCGHYDVLTALCREKGDLLGFATGKLQAAAGTRDA